MRVEHPDFVRGFVQDYSSSLLSASSMASHPKAKDVQVEENDFTVLHNGVPNLKYIYAG